jgi:hypothetical protein
MTAPDVDYFFGRGPKGLLYDAHRSRMAKLLYVILDERAGSKGVCWPGRKALANQLACGLTAVDRAIEELVEARYLTVKRRHHDSSLYYLRPIPLESIPPDGDSLGGVNPTFQESIPLLDESIPLFDESIPPGNSLIRPIENETHQKRDSLGSRSNGAFGSSPISPSPELHLLSSSSEDTGETLQNFDDEEATPQPKPSKKSKSEPKPRSKSQSDPELANELATTLAKADPAIVQDLFESWASTGEGKFPPSPERLGYIARALEWGYPVEDVRAALVGWVHDDWKDRPTNKDVSILLRDHGQVEKFRDLKRNAPMTNEEYEAAESAKRLEPYKPPEYSESTNRLVERIKSANPQYRPAEVVLPAKPEPPSRPFRTTNSMAEARKNKYLVPHGFTRDCPCGEPSGSAPIHNPPLPDWWKREQELANA